MNERRRTLEQHDVSDLIGLHVMIVNTAQEVTVDDGEMMVEVPDIEALSAAAAVARCLVPIRLRGNELKVIRRIAGWTALDLAAKMGEKTSSETISRWENEKQPMGGYAEKVFRLVICEELAASAPGVDYQAGAIAGLMVVDAWRVDEAVKMPPLVFERIKVKVDGRKIVNAWEYENPVKCAA
jgi:transcriptional regulator with XRE-family HTH domain